MRIYLENGELAEITVKQGKNEHIYEYYIGSIKIGVLNDEIMENNILILEDSIKEPKIAEEIKEAINGLPRENILQELEENKDIEDYINEKYGEQEKIKEIRKIELNGNKAKIKENKDKDKDKSNEESELTEKIVTTDDVKIKQTIDLDERANDMQDVKKWLGGKIPKDVEKVGVVESSDMREYGGKNTTRYSLLTISKSGRVEPLEKYIPQLKQRTADGNNPREESYQVRTDGSVEKDAVLSEYEIGDKIIQLDNKEYGRVELNIGKEARNSTQTVSQEVRSQNTLFATSKEQRSVVGEYESNGENNVEENIKEAEEHEKENPNCDKLQAEDIDGDRQTRSHIHENSTEVILKDGTKMTFEKLAVRWGLFDDNGHPDIESAKDKYIKEQEENMEKEPEQIIEELDEELEDPRAPEARSKR